MNLADDGLRHRLLSTGPLGLWRTLPGSHTQLFDELIDFRPDGSGEMSTSSAMHGTHTLRFVWRMAGYGVVECKPLYASPELDDQGQPEVADWFRLLFVLEKHSSDAGWHWVLKERNALGFWDLNAPLVPVEPALRSAGSRFSAATATPNSVGTRPETGDAQPRASNRAVGAIEVQPVNLQKKVTYRHHGRKVESVVLVHHLLQMGGTPLDVKAQLGVGQQIEADRDELQHRRADPIT